MFVPSLSWQNDHLYKNGSKVRFLPGLKPPLGRISLMSAYATSSPADRQDKAKQHRPQQHELSTAQSADESTLCQDKTRQDKLAAIGSIDA